MKRTIVSSLALATISLLLFGCSSNNKSKDTSSKDAKSEKIASSEKAASESKAKESSKKKAESESKAKASSIAKAESESKASSEALAQSQAESAKQASSQQAQTAQQSQSSSSVQQQNQEPDFSLSLTDFINRYGMSPAAYRMTKMGMSEKDALYATPDDKQSSGEIQLEGMYRNGQDPNANSN